MPDKFLDILPDPNYRIDSAGFEDATGGVAGPGFIKVNLSASQKKDRDFTIAGKMVNRANMYHSWLIGLNYNPLTKAQFDPVYNFLMEKKSSQKSFYVSLPQYKLPKDSDFALFVQNNTPTVSGAVSAGVSSFEITDPAWSSNDYSSSGLPDLGDVFNIIDPNNSAHTKTYMITRVETYDTYKNAVTSGNIRIHFKPGLQRKITNGASIEFNDPLFHVYQSSDVQEHQLNAEGLYDFSVSLIEAAH
jgi:hypothetical protein